jgi:hypothetical protein
MRPCLSEPLLPILYQSVLKFIVTTRHHVLKDTREQGSRMHRFAYITLIAKSIDIAILATCQGIYNEAYPILQRQMRTLQTEPVRLIAEGDSFRTIPKIARRVWYRDINHIRLLPSPSQGRDTIEYSASNAQALNAFLDKFPFNAKQPSTRSQALLIAFDAEPGDTHTPTPTYTYSDVISTFIHSMNDIALLAGREIGVWVKAGSTGHHFMAWSDSNVQIFFNHCAKEGPQGYEYKEQKVPTDEQWREDWEVTGAT